GRRQQVDCRIRAESGSTPGAPDARRRGATACGGRVRCWFVPVLGFLGPTEAPGGAGLPAQLTQTSSGPFDEIRAFFRSAAHPCCGGLRAEADSVNSCDSAKPSVL